MDDQGYGTVNWEHLEQWAFGELLKLVKLRDGRQMLGPPELQLQDFIGKRLRVRFKSEEPNSVQYGTLLCMITGILLVEHREEDVREIVFGIAPIRIPRGAPDVEQHTLCCTGVRIALSRDAATPRFIANLIVSSDDSAIRRSFVDLRPTGVHILWD